jgi:hypothetical protein
MIMAGINATRAGHNEMTDIRASQEEIAEAISYLVTAHDDFELTFTKRVESTQTSMLRKLQSSCELSRCETFITSPGKIYLINVR